MKRRHPGILRANYPIVEKYSAAHIAVRTLRVHAEMRKVCVGRELRWSDRPNHVIEQEWFSRTRLKKQWFSSFAYEFLTYELLLDGWLTMPSQPTQFETLHLEKKHPLMRALMDECKKAATAEGNTDVLPLIAKVHEFLDLYEEATMCRFKVCGIRWPATDKSE